MGRFDEMAGLTEGAAFTAGDVATAVNKAIKQSARTLEWAFIYHKGLRVSLLVDLGRARLGKPASKVSVTISRNAKGGRVGGDGGVSSHGFKYPVKPGKLPGHLLRVLGLPKGLTEADLTEATKGRGSPPIQVSLRAEDISPSGDDAGLTEAQDPSRKINQHALAANTALRDLGREIKQTVSGSLEQSRLQRLLKKAQNALAQIMKLSEGVEDEAAAHYVDLSDVPAELVGEYFKRVKASLVAGEAIMGESAGRFDALLVEAKYIKINGKRTKVPKGAVAYKYTDPTEEARWIKSKEEADKIAAEDDSLIVWVEAESTSLFDRLLTEGCGKGCKIKCSDPTTTEPKAKPKDDDTDDDDEGDDADADADADADDEKKAPPFAKKKKKKGDDEGDEEDADAAEHLDAAGDALEEWERTRRA